MKKIFLISLITILLTSMAACQNTNDEPVDDYAPFAEAEWEFYNEKTGEEDIIYFEEDGSFSYHCACGEPIGDSDVYDSYRYDEEQLLITLYNDYDDSEKEIRLIFYNAIHLLLEIDGVIRDFSIIGTDTSSNFWFEQAESYLAGYELRRTLTKFTEDGVVLAAINYDLDMQAPKNTLEEWKLAENVCFFELDIFSVWTVEKDGYEMEQSYDVSFTEIGKMDVEDMMENGGASGYLWLNEEMEIEKVVIFGMTSVYE